MKNASIFYFSKHDMGKGGEESRRTILTAHSRFSKMNIETARTKPEVTENILGPLNA